jgi:hypothetical protein
MGRNALFLMGMPHVHDLVVPHVLCVVAFQLLCLERIGIDRLAAADRLDAHPSPGNNTRMSEHP